MAFYTYEAKDSSGKLRKGEIEAQSQQDAVTKVDALGLFLLSLSEKTVKARIPRHVPLKETADFTHQLSTLINSGSTLLTSLHTLAGQMRRAKLQPILVEIIFEVEQGVNFSGALRKYPTVFPQLYIALVSVGEESGTLGQNLKRIAQFLEEQIDFKNNIISIMMYPAMIVVVALVTIFILMRFVVPKLADIFTELGQILPAPTQILMTVSDLFSRYWLILVLAVASLFYFVKTYFKDSAHRLMLDAFMFKIPLLGEVLNRIEVARFARTLSVLLTNGVPIDASLRVLTQAASNVFFRREINTIEASIKEGSSLSKAMTNVTVFSPAFINVVTVGEVSGTLASVLATLSGDYNKEIDRKIKAFLNAVELILIVGVGLIVGFVVLSMLLPIFEMDFNF